MKRICFAGALAVSLVFCLLPVQGAETKSLSGHVPEITRRLSSTGRLAATNELHLAIGLPLHNAAKLDALIRDLSNPASPNYRHYLSPPEFTAQFGATAAEYAALKKFAQMNGFKISRTHDSRTLLNVTARAADVERAFHLKLKKFKHPTEAREFFAPDAEPTVDAALAVADVQGLSDYSRPRPKLLKAPLTNKSPRSGTGLNGSYFGDDFRNAYAPGTTLTGAGQRVGLLQFDGFYANDIAAYAAGAGGGRANIPVETVSVGGFNGIPSGNGGDVEVSLDIEMAMAMAPGLDKIVVFEASPSTGDVNSLLTAMAARTDINQFSCSWGWSGGPNVTTENCFKQFIVQGQSFFNASGDSDAFTTGAGSINGVDNPGLNNQPSSSPYITSVGGTTLTMNGSGASYASERVWNWGNSQGSSGGISSHYAIPDWQSGLSMTACGGSGSYRNTPDVAMTGDNVYVVSGGGGTGAGGIGGTSCASPLWAGFMALANQQAAAAGQPALGFINPAIYALAAKSSYTTAFNDVTNGDNASPNSPGAFYAVPGYDLATGLGTPNGTYLINALLNPDSLSLTPSGAVSLIRYPDGSFNQTDQTYSLTNTGTNALTWSLVNTCAWLSVSSSGGSLGVGSIDYVVASLTPAASNLTAGAYSASLLFSNLASGVGQTRLVTLQIMDSLLILPTNSFSFSGISGALLTPSAQTLTLTNAGAGPLSWSLNNTSAWFTVSPASGNLSAATATNITFALTASASNLANGIFTAVFEVTNVTGHSVQGITNRLLIGQPLVQNGGFESGNYAPWTLTDTTGPDGVVTVIGSAQYPPYDGTYAFGFGQAYSPAHLSQDLVTTPGQTYLLSFWVENPTGASDGLSETFQVNWNGVSVTNLDNPPGFFWQNFNFVLTATGAVTTLEFAVQNDPDYFGLDDVSVTPVFAPALSVQPTNFAVASRGNAAFSAAAAGTDPLVYQWYKDGTRLFDGPGVFGVATTNLSLTRVLAADAGNYWLVVTNAYGAVTSSVAALTVVSSADGLEVAPDLDFSISGVAGGPFAGLPQTFFLTNAGGAPLSWSLLNTSSWLNVSSSQGVLVAGLNTNATITLAAAVTQMPVGTYVAVILFSNQTSQVTQPRAFTLQISSPLTLSPSVGFTAHGAPGGPFDRTNQVFALTNLGLSSQSWGLVNTSAWLSASASAGSLAGSTGTAFAVGLSPAANGLLKGLYTATVLMTNSAGGSLALPFTLRIDQSLIDNGGFETGDFTGWALVGTPPPSATNFYNGVVNYYPYVHSGNYGAYFGDGNVATLSQNICTEPGQTYLASCWLINPTSGSGQTFLINWNTNTAGTNLIFAQTNPPVLPWTNLTFVVQAAGTNTTLQFGLQNIPAGFGLDDVSVTPVFPPRLTAQPTNLLAVSRGSAAFSALAGGTAPLVYQWFKDGMPLADGSGVSGSGTTNLTLPRVLPADAGNYWLVVTNAYGAVTSSVAALTVSASDVLVVAPDQDFSLSGLAGGPFSGLPQTFFLTNVGGAPLSWSLLNTSSWLSTSSSQGVLAAGANTNVTVSLAAAASQLPAGTYAATLQFSNQTSQITQPRAFALQISTALTLSPSAGFIANGPPGGPFDVTNQVFALTNFGLSSQSWGLVNTSAWLTASASVGSVAGSTNTAITLGLSPAASGLAAGGYTATVLMTNTDGSRFALPFTLRIGQSLIDNGGFETGDFTSWLLVGNAVIGKTSYNTVASNPSFVHSGTYGAFLGDVALASLSQSFRTVPGQTYLLSGWLNNLQAGAEQQFLINWNTNAALTNQLFFITNPPVLPWTNFTYVVKASSTNATLQFGAENVPNGFALDDVSVIPVSSPQFLTQPTNLTLWAAASATFSASAVGSGPLAYQWQHSGTNLAGALASTLTLTNLNTLQAGSYRLILTNAYGAVTSSVVTLTVNLLPSALNLVSSTNPAGYKTSLNFTASVLPGGASGAVQFFTNGTAFDLQPLAAGAATSASLATLPRGTNLIAAIYSGDSQYQPATNALAQVLTNHPPQALSVNVPLLAGSTLSLPVAALATNWSDADGDVITLSAIAPSTNGVTVPNALPTLFYANSNYVNDRFVCTLSDGYGGTNYQTVNIVIVPVTNSTPVIAGISRSVAGRVTLSLRGGSGSTYLLESKTNFMSGVWMPVVTNSPDLSGVWSFTDLSPTNTPARFYRLRLLP